MCAENDCGCGKASLWVPNGTKTTYRINKTDPAKLFIESVLVPPTGYIYVGYDENDVVQKTGFNESFWNSCKCTNDGGHPELACNPWQQGNEHGCDNECVTCDEEFGSKNIIGEPVKFMTGGFVNMAMNVGFADYKTPLPSAFPAMFDVPEINAMYNSFITKIYRGLPQPVCLQGKDFVTAPDGYFMAVINLCGRALAAPVPIVVYEAIIGPPPDTPSGTCNCTTGKDGDPGCEWGKTDLTPPRHFCYGDCKGTCRLTVGKFRVDGGFDEVYSSQTYRF